MKNKKRNLSPAVDIARGRLPAIYNWVWAEPIHLLSFHFYLLSLEKGHTLNVLQSVPRRSAKYEILCFTVVIHNYPSVTADRILDTSALYHNI